jgi:membrane associated rhomboid family serine protease
MGQITLVTGIIMAVTVLVSLLAFNSEDLRGKLMFYPYRIKQNNEWYRFLTGGFIHLDFGHLFFNMMALYFFGPIAETYYKAVWGIQEGMILFAVMYVVSIIMAGVYSFFKHQNDYGYLALGASGAVSAVIFTTLVFDPWNDVYVYFIPIPGIIFGVLYLVFSQYMSRKQSDNVGHDAHFYGAVFGFLFPLVLRPSLFMFFIEQLKTFKLFN